MDTIHNASFIHRHLNNKVHWLKFGKQFVVLFVNHSTLLAKWRSPTEIKKKLS